ncbi:MAG: VIT1/CCC1 transporter family protein [Bacteroidales bacterium]|nr:MAG: VIT1/CCC1 transporter family protein [Bacteroidales bacterium]
MDISEKVRQRILLSQKNEITEYHIYKKLAIKADDENRKILLKIAEEELNHYNIWKRFTDTDVKPNRFKIFRFYLISRIFGLTFGLKLMERGEENAQQAYSELDLKTAEIEKIIKEEGDHEDELLQMLDENFLKYTGSIVLGLNDALVELTGALAGFTLALKNTRLIALVGLVTGIAAALSMASSEYLSTKAEETEKSPVKASVFTGLAYIITVFLLIFPYLILTNYFVCLTITLLIAIFIIYIFNYYISVTRDLSFRKHFLEMIILSFGVATLSFFIGYLLRSVLGVEE